MIDLASSRYFGDCKNNSAMYVVTKMHVWKKNIQMCWQSHSVANGRKAITITAEAVDASTGGPSACHMAG